MKPRYGLLLFAVTGLSAGMAQADIYTWVDGGGVHHYSDSPSGRQAKRADLPGIQPIEGDPGALERLQAQQAGASGQNDPSAEAPDSRTPALAKPEPDTTFRDARGRVPVSLTVGGSDELRTGEQITYYLDGSPIPQSPTDSTQFELANVSRGSHTLSAALLYQGRELRRTEPVTFYMKPPSAISPLNANQGGGNGEADTPNGAPVATPAGNAAGVPAAPRFNTTTAPAGRPPS